MKKVAIAKNRVTAICNSNGEEMMILTNDRLIELGLNNDLMVELKSGSDIVMVEPSEYNESNFTIKEVNDKRFPVMFECHNWYRKVFMPEKRPSECPKTIEVNLHVGMPCTYSIGTDSYGKMIIDISETKDGRLKEVFVAERLDAPSHMVKRIRYNKKKMEFREVGGGYGFYHFGRKLEHRDRSF